MNAGKIKLYVLPSALYLRGTPVLIADGCLLMDRFTERLSVKLKLRSMDDREITAVTVKVILFDAVGMPCGEEVFHTFRSLKVGRDREFGETPFSIFERAARSFTAYVTEVTFGDFSVWQNKVPFGAVSKLRTLEHALGGEEMARQYATRYGNDCVYLPTDDKEMWFCTCGAANRSDEPRCHHCRRNRSALQTINYDGLRAETERRMAAEQREEEEEQHLRERRRERGRKAFTAAMIVLPIILAAVLIAATVPPFFARREDYKRATSLLNSRKYAEASDAFSRLGDYLDSREMAEKEVWYQKAQFLLTCARNSDAAGLSYLGMSRSDLEEGEDLGVFLYREADRLLESLGDYKEAKALRAGVTEALETYARNLLQKKYEGALARMEKGEYLAACDDFLSLGDYQNAQEMVSESMYQRALSVFRFCEENNVRGISLRLSHQQGEKTVVSMPGSVLTRLGSELIYQLKLCFMGDGVEFLYEDKPSIPGLEPICSAAAAEFDSLGEYKDCVSLAARARELGDTTAEFYTLLRNGEFDAALDWLSSYPEDEIPERGSYPGWFELYRPFCSGWELEMGDSALIPYSAGIETELLYFGARISIDGKEAILQIADDDGLFSVELRAPLGSTDFSFSPDGSSYYVSINQADHLTILRFSEEGEMLSSCEYHRI